MKCLRVTLQRIGESTCGEVENPTHFDGYPMAASKTVFLGSGEYAASNIFSRHSAGDER